MQVSAQACPVPRTGDTFARARVVQPVNNRSTNSTACVKVRQSMLLDTTTLP